MNTEHHPTTHGIDCYLCHRTTVELRPYGPRGEWVCFACAFSTPERKAQTEASFSAQINACGDGAVIGEPTGPRPHQRSRS